MSGIGPFDEPLTPQEKARFDALMRSTPIAKPLLSAAEIEEAKQSTRQLRRLHERWWKAFRTITETMSRRDPEDSEFFCEAARATSAVFNALQIPKFEDEEDRSWVIPTAETITRVMEETAELEALAPLNMKWTDPRVTARGRKWLAAKRRGYGSCVEGIFETHNDALDFAVRHTIALKEQFDIYVHWESNVVYYGFDGEY